MGRRSKKPQKHSSSSGGTTGGVVTVSETPRVQWRNLFHFRISTLFTTYKHMLLLDIVEKKKNSCSSSHLMWFDVLSCANVFFNNHIFNDPKDLIVIRRALTRKNRITFYGFLLQYYQFVFADIFQEIPRKLKLATMSVLIDKIKSFNDPSREDTTIEDELAVYKKYISELHLVPGLYSSIFSK